MATSLKHLIACGIEGIDGYLVDVEINRVESETGTGKINMVGLPDAAVREGIDRVLPAIMNSSLYHNWADHIVINLAPANRRKEGPAFDLAIALGLAASMPHEEAIPLPCTMMFLAELALDGSLRPVRGALSAAMAAREAGLDYIMVSPANADEAAAVAGLKVVAPDNLTTAVGWLRSGAFTEQLWQAPAQREQRPMAQLDLGDVRGQAAAIRALTIAAAGAHNVLMMGPPGSGKTMLARRLPGLLPSLTTEEALEVTRIHSVAGYIDGAEGLLQQRPFRAPHHNVSGVGLIGGGSHPRPGEVSLAHHGVLFLDELPEYPRTVLECLRQPLEDGSLTISRSAARVTFPSRCMLIAAMNPCPCGYVSHPTRRCSCNQDQIHRYRSRISGPLLDRIDLHLDVPAQKPSELDSAQPGPDSQSVRQDVVAARELMQQRQGCPNSRLTPAELRRVAPLQDSARRMLHYAIDELGLSARAHDRILKVARTIGDMSCTQELDESIIAEAIAYRLLDRQQW